MVSEHRLELAMWPNSLSVQAIQGQPIVAVVIESE